MSIAQELPPYAYSIAECIVVAVGYAAAATTPTTSALSREKKVVGGGGLKMNQK
jgi:hypothetical protein